jgi:hypothetical protein
MWASRFFQSHPSSGFGVGPFGILMLLLSVGIAALGVFIIYHGMRTARSRYRDR